MTSPEVIIRLVVVAVALSAVRVEWRPRLAVSVRNWTAVAVVVSWVIAQYNYLLTGAVLPTNFFLYLDFAVIAVIMAKHADCDLSPYRSERHRLQCLLLERSPADRIVLLIFPVAWLIYAAGLHPYYAWYLLWALKITQLLAAGWEALLTYRRDAEAVVSRPEPPGTHLLVAYQVEARFG